MWIANVPLTGGSTTFTCAAPAHLEGEANRLKGETSEKGRVCSGFSRPHVHSVATARVSGRLLHTLQDSRDTSANPNPN